MTSSGAGSMLLVTIRGYPRLSLAIIAIPC